jgi:hypothetical protein
VLIGERFLYLHPPKTGGWTTRRVLRAAGLEQVDPQCNQHSALHELPSSLLLGRTVFATVREPCAWYRSYLHYDMRQDGSAGSCVGPLLEDRPFELRRVLTRFLTLPSDATVRILGVTHQEVPWGRLVDLQIGPYSWMLMHLLGSTPWAGEPCVSLGVDALIDTGRLREGLAGLMSSFGHSIEPALSSTKDDNCNADHGRRLLRYEGSVADVFDDELVDLVYARDRWVVDLMGYTGPGSVATSPCVPNR